MAALSKLLALTAGEIVLVKWAIIFHIIFLIKARFINQTWMVVDALQVSNILKTALVAEDCSVSVHGIATFASLRRVVVFSKFYAI